MTVPKGSAVLPLGWQVNKPLWFDDRSSVLKLMMILVARAPTYFCTLMHFNKIPPNFRNQLFICLFGLDNFREGFECQFFGCGCSMTGAVC